MTNDLNNIRFYAQIVERGSLTAAAESLGVAKSMLSQHLAALERELGVLLIRRTSRRLEITDIGKRYYAQCQVILGEIARASSLADSARTAPRGKLRIACPVNFAQVVMAPVVAAYLAKYPEVDLSLAVTNRANALIDEGFDFALYIGSPVKKSTLVTSAFKLDAEVLVASPALLARAGTPRSPGDLGAFASASEHAADARGKPAAARRSWRVVEQRKQFLRRCRRKSRHGAPSVAMRPASSRVAAHQRCNRSTH